MKLATSLFLLGVFCLTAESGSAQTQFSATLTCGTLPSTVQEQTLGLGPDGMQLLVHRQVCTWSNFEIGGVKVKQSLMTGVGTTDASKKVSGARGFDWGTLESGDHYFAQWEEKALQTGSSMLDFGTWTIVLGTGKLKGLLGTASYFCPGSTQPHVLAKNEVTCTMNGAWVLPSAAPSAPPAKKKQ